MPPPPPKVEEDDESWMATYADAITLLMAFFVLLVSVSKVDLAMYEQVADGLSETISKEERKSLPKELQADAAEVVMESQAQEAVRVGIDDSGVVLEFNSSAFFKPGSAELRYEAIPVMQSVVELVKSPQYLVFNMDVEGHTDDDPISTMQFPSNWELSSGRASAVVRFFAELGVDPLRMRVMGYGDTRPKVPNRTPEGVPILENQVENRRVVVRLHQKSFVSAPPKFVPLTSIAREVGDPQQDPNQPSDGAAQPANQQ